MLLVNTYLDASPIHGVGLFASGVIPKGTEIYKPSPRLDILLSNENFQKLDTFSQQQIKHYGYFDTQSNKWHLAFDDIRFCNHSKDSNITQDPNTDTYTLIAKRDIKAGEELTQDYSEFENLRDELKKAL